MSIQKILFCMAFLSASVMAIPASAQMSGMRDGVSGGQGMTSGQMRQNRPMMMKKKLKKSKMSKARASRSHMMMKKDNM